MTAKELNKEYRLAMKCESFLGEEKKNFSDMSISGLHGYTHEEPNKLSEKQNRDIFEYTYELLTKFVGEPPKGIVTPMCQISAASSQLLVDKGIEYDHSAMHRDCLPYYLRVDDK
jgi:peptidoglycan/xylan/chitin deacetylase (PgdA/CDA1 family)